MHLKDLYIRNVGPLRLLDMKLPFTHGNTPKPVVLVGTSGSGKSTLLGQIADSLWEIAAQVFEDIARPVEGLNRPYLVPLGGSSIRSGTRSSIALMTFTDSSGNAIKFGAKSGPFDNSILDGDLCNRFESVADWKSEDSNKKVAPVNKDDLEEFISPDYSCAEHADACQAVSVLSLPSGRPSRWW